MWHELRHKLYQLAATSDTAKTLHSTENWAYGVSIYDFLTLHERQDLEFF
jgi:hypothetical protein